MDFNDDSRDRESLRKQTYFHKVIEFIAVTQAQTPAQILDFGHHIKQYDGSGFLGGTLSAIRTDQFGILQSAIIQIATLLPCGHTVESVSQISGYCQICGRVCCNIDPLCLRVCELTGITVCRQHYTIKHGVVVSTFAQRSLFWKLKAKRIARQKELTYGQNPLPGKKWFTRI
jgi:hypothetical protein